ncbi:MAG: hypothetical protein ACUVQ1_00995 [Candidatus Kapaibacteriales bacterium]
MGKKIKREIYINYAFDLIEMLEKCLNRLKYSYSKSRSINLEKNDFEDPELEILEALCSRFARLSDMLIQKAFRFIDIYELADPDISVLDRINNAERRNLIRSAGEFKYIRQLRNEVAHNYSSDAFAELFKEIMAYIPILINGTEKTIEFLKKEIINL